MVKNSGKNDKKIFLVAQEIELAKLLAGNNKNARDKALRNLKKWFYNRSRAVRKCFLKSLYNYDFSLMFSYSSLISNCFFVVAFTDDDFQRIWKGLFYSMWMSDKPLTQVSENYCLHTLNEQSVLCFRKNVQRIYQPLYIYQHMTYQLAFLKRV